MQAKKLMLRCYAERKDSLWLAYCLDFSLAAQADTLDEAKTKLEAQIREYVHDALAGVDRPHAPLLLTRRAPWAYWFKYWLAGIAMWLARETRQPAPRLSQRFREVMPLVPASC